MRHNGIKNRLEIVKDDPLAAEDLTDEWIGELEDAIKTPGTGLALCRYGRALVSATILGCAPNHKGLWNEQRVRRAFEALVKAIAASQHTDFYANCRDRPRDFLDGLRAAYWSEEEKRRLIEQIESANEDVLRRAIPLESAGTLEPV